MVPPAMPGEVDEEEVKIAVNNVNFWYGGFHAIHDVSMPIMANKVTAFIGPSGCGKSTLLRIFNLMYRMYPGQRAEGDDAGRRKPPHHENASGPYPRPRRHGVPEADPVPDEHL